MKFKGKIFSRNDNIRENHGPLEQQTGCQNIAKGPQYEKNQSIIINDMKKKIRAA